MDRTMHCALVLLSILGSLEGFVQRDMTGDVFVFRKDTGRSHVVLKPLKEESLHSFTLCIITITDRSKGYSLFEIKFDPPYNSEITVLKSNSKSYILIVGDEWAEFYPPEVINQHVYLCFSWESANGTARLWVDRRSLTRKSLSKGYVIQGNPSIKLGMRRTKLPAEDQYVGEIYEVSMWDYVLSRNEVQGTTNWNRPLLPANYLNWKNLTYELVDNVVVEPY
ncbi:mucosal pentraxin-like isoform X2 [Lissotriton helveticus]